MRGLLDKFKALKTWQKIVVVFLFLAVFGAATGSGSDSSSSSESSSSNEKVQESKKDTLPGLGETVSDGKFSFAVWKVKCGHTSVGSGFMVEKASGQFCIIDISVKNTGDEAQTLFSSNQKVIDDQGREFQTADTAMMAMDQTDLWLKEINPGLQINGQLVFDMPLDAKPVKIELHDSAFSGGALVDLTKKAK